MKYAKTISARMSETGGVTSGFDYLRYILAFSVLLWHSYGMTQGWVKAFADSEAGLSWFTYPILPMFFALSGFLVASSLLRTPTLIKFLWLRVIRIMPALAVEVTLSALVLGPIFTTFSWREYFSDPLFVTYFLNIFGDIHYFLPGVFASNPISGVVNPSLWTVPYELECYIALAALALAGIRVRSQLFMALFMGAMLMLLAYSFHRTPPVGSPANIAGRPLILFFLAGILLNLNREVIPLSAPIALVCAIAGMLCLKHPNLVYISPLPIAYFTVWLGLMNPKKVPVLMGGDYSYGIYLYAAPIQQSLVAALPGGHAWLVNVAGTIFCVSLFSAFSWHWVEKPALKLKSWTAFGLLSR